MSVRQIMVLLVVALLAPATDLLPTMAARQAGRGGWLIGLGMLPLLLLALWVCGKVFCGGDLCVRVGKSLGYTIMIIYAAWILFLLAAVLRLAALRVELAYSGVPSIFFGAAVAALGVWMAMGKTAALARAAEIFYLALTVVLTGALLLALFQIEWRNLYPIRWAALPGGSISAGGLLLNIVPAAVLGTYVPPKVRGGRRVCGWTVAFCGAIALMLAAVQGCIGSGLTASLDMPYLIMVQGLGIKGAFQRTEALVAAVWLLSDLILAGVLLCSCREYVARLTTRQWGRRSVPAAAVGAMLAGWLLLPGEEQLRGFCMTVLPATGIVLGLIIPVFLLLISGVRRRNRR